MIGAETLLHVILPHPAEPRVLLLPDGGGGWTLPRLPVETPEVCFDAFSAGMAAREVAGCAVAMLHAAYARRATPEHGCRFVLVAENGDPSYTPPDGARWAAAAELDAALSPGYLRPVLDDWFRERTTGQTPPLRPPWAFPGWEGRARAWIAAQIALHGWRQTGEVELVRKWSITCVMKAPTDAGMLFFKAVPPTFAREIGVTRYLAALHPDILPSIVAADEAERWLLLRDFGLNPLGDIADPDVWHHAMRAYAALQVDMASHVDALLARGAMDYRLETLTDRLDAMLADDVLLVPDRHLTAAQIDRLRALAPRFKAAIDELHGFALPVTLVHGDFHPWNIVAGDGRVLFFDWTDASVGSPFYDTSFFFDAVSREVFPDRPEVVSALRDAYLHGLAPFAPVETLRQAVSVGQLVGFIQHAANYHHLLRQVDPVDHWSLSYMTYLLKHALLCIEPAAPAE